MTISGIWPTARRSALRLPVALALAVAGAGAGCGAVDDDQACDEPTEVLRNGGFDLVDPPWRRDPPSGLLCGASVITPHSGTLTACLGGGVDGSTNTLSNDLELPAGTTRVRLAGQLCTATQELGGSATDDVLRFELLEGATAIAALGPRTSRGAGDACTFTAFELEATLPPGPRRTVTFQLQSQLDADGATTTFFVDSLALTASCE